jgi:hypothetical protein
LLSLMDNRVGNKKQKKKNIQSRNTARKWILNVIAVSLTHIGCFFKFHLIVGVEELIVKAVYRLRITDQLFKSYVLHEWCVHNRLFNAYEVKLKKTSTVTVSNLDQRTKLWDAL